MPSPVKQFNASEDLPQFAVAGLGKMGIMHAAMIQASGLGRVGALIDADANTARQVSSMGAQAPTFNSLEACLNQMRPAGVWITTPQFLHRPMLETCLAHGLPVFCEKPLAHTLADAEAMAQAAARHPELPIAVGFMLGHNPLFQRAAAMIGQGVIGEIKSFNASCRLSQVFSPKKGWTFQKDRAGGGVLINSGCHLLFVLYQLLGLPQQVTARGSGVHNDVEDTFAALLDYAGFWGTVEVTWSVPGHELQTHDVEIIGTGGTIEVGNEVLRLWLSKALPGYRTGWSEWRRQTTAPVAEFSLSPDYCGDEFFLEDRDFIEAVRDRRPPKVGVAEALQVQRLLDALYRSMAAGHAIELVAREPVS